jgi:hypothetical protein
MHALLAHRMRPADELVDRQKAIAQQQNNRHPQV